MSEKAAEPTIASHITPFEMGLPPDKKHVRFSTKELDLLKNVLAGPPELQGDGVHSLSRDNKRVQENAFRTGLPPDRQMDFHAINASPLVDPQTKIKFNIPAKFMASAPVKFWMLSYA